MPYLRALSAFRDEVRKLAINKADPKDLLALSDRLRDYDLAEMGVALDDSEGKVSLSFRIVCQVVNLFDIGTGQTAEP